MTPPPNQAEAIVVAALDLPAEQRPDYLEGACGKDPELRRLVEGLLKAHVRVSGQTTAPPSRSTILLAVPPAGEPGDRISRYKLLQQIGEGACGVVYMAEQQEPVRRRVALKVMKFGMDTKEVIARFEAERQALALMDH